MVSKDITTLARQPLSLERPWIDVLCQLADLCRLVRTSATVRKMRRQARGMPPSLLKSCCGGNADNDERFLVISARDGGIGLMPGR